MSADAAANHSVCVVAILRDEVRFLDEWIAYHRILGVDHFFLYDDDLTPLLREFLRPHASYVTVVEWHERDSGYPGNNHQTRAYLHALRNGAERYKWVTFIDGDEFIVLRKHANLRAFLEEFDEIGAVALQWHVFSNSGFQNDPPGLITSSLLYRQKTPWPRTKCVTKPELIVDIRSAHNCDLKRGNYYFDANKRRASEPIDGTILYPGRTDVAHINHYMCRSLATWMKRVERGDVIATEKTAAKENLWRFDQARCLEECNALNQVANDCRDDFMLRYEEPVLNYIRQLHR